MKKYTVFALVMMCAWLSVDQAGWAQKYDDKEHAALAKAFKDAKVSLAKGLVASEREGKPISGKFEVEDGKLQLSVYTMKGDKFSEVIVDHQTGKVAKVEAITGGEDLTASKAQAEAMAKAKRSLGAALAEATKANKGYRPVAVTPTLREGHAVADITLMKGGEFKTVSEKLD